MLYRNLLFPLIGSLDPERAHHLAADALAFAERHAATRALLSAIAGRIPSRPVTVCGMRFPNVLGVAGGFDKDARIAGGLARLGFGHVEVGTLTPRPQQGNPRPRIFRLPQHGAIINRMGFPNCGVEAALPRIRALAKRRDFVLGVSLGKQKETPLESAAQDYIAVMRRVHEYAGYLAVNISSPNTPGLRELQGKRYLATMLAALVRENRTLNDRRPNRPCPLFVKIAPDLSATELDDILESVIEAGAHGIIATNTTLSRRGVESAAHAEESGGLSGAPLRRRSTRLIARIHRLTGGSLPIIGVGGVSNARDAQEKLDAGAPLVQIYTGLIYEGPGVAGRILRGLS